MKLSLKFIGSLLFVLLTITTIANAGLVSLAWDPNAVPPDGYRIYSKTTTGAYGTVPIWEGDGSNTTCTVNVVDDKQTAFVATAFVRGNLDNAEIESGYSNEVIWTPVGMQPEAPKGFRVLIDKIISWFRTGVWKS